MYATRRRQLRRVLFALGTVVCPAYRSLGLATNLMLCTFTFLCVRYIQGTGVWRPDHALYERVTIDSLSDAECKFRFNFTRSELHRLFDALGIPTRFVDNNRCVYSGEEGLLLLLRRLNFPNRLVDLVPEFGLSESRLSILLEIVSSHIWGAHKHLLEDPTIWVPDLPHFASAIYNHLGTYDNVWGFIDGTLRGIARPRIGQHLTYSGHKRKHGLKYQGIALPNGLIGYLWGPTLGRRHDSYMLFTSGLLPLLRWMMVNAGSNYVLYGDLGYPLTDVIQVGFRGATLTTDQKKFNKTMSSARVVVEWMFGDILSLWTFGCLKRRQQILITPVARYYFLSALFTNCHTCIHGGNKISLKFGIAPPSLEEYIHLTGAPGAPVTRI